MKVTRKQLYKQLIPFFEDLGYTYFKDTISAASGLFAKKIDNNLYVSIGITTSNLYYNSFTCNMYMAQSLDFGLMYKGILMQCFPRPGNYLTEEELISFRGTESKLTDIWWQSDDINSIESFKMAVRLAEPRFVNNLELRKKIINNEGAIHQHNLTNRVKMLVKKGIPKFETQFVPEKEKDGIPLIWFETAEFVQKEVDDLFKMSVLSLAADSYRQYILDEKAER